MTCERLSMHDPANVFPRETLLRGPRSPTDPELISKEPKEALPPRLWVLRRDFERSFICW
jgi:hypothetical protein